MKTSSVPKWSLPVLLILFLLALSGCGLLSKKGETGSELSAALPPDDGYFERYLQQAIARLDAGDPRQAEQIMREARREATRRRDESGQERAAQVTERIRRLYGPYYAYVSDARALRQQGDLSQAQQAMAAALKRIDDFRESGIPELTMLDQQLELRARRENDFLVQERQRAYQERLRRGEEYFWTGDYAQAIPALEEARRYLLPDREQAEIDRIDGLIRQASFRQYIAQGDQYLEQENLRAALQAYRQAIEINDDYAVQEKIRDVENRLHYALLAEGQEAFFAGRYQEASDILAEAGAIRQSDYLTRVRQSAYEQLRERGHIAFDSARYEQAVEQYQLARLFIDDDAIRQDIGLAADARAYQQEVLKAEAYIEQGRMPAARRRLQRAARYVDTEQVRQRLDQVRAYEDKVKQGKQALKNDPTAAYRLYAEAYKLFPTEEASRGMQRAEAAGGKPSSVNPGDFFN